MKLRREGKLSLSPEWLTIGKVRKDTPQTDTQLQTEAREGSVISGRSNVGKPCMWQWVMNKIQYNAVCGKSTLPDIIKKVSKPR